MRRIIASRRPGTRGVGGNVIVSLPTAQSVSGFSDANYYQGSASQGLAKIATLRLVIQVMSAVPVGGSQKILIGRVDNTGVDGGWYVATNIANVGDLTLAHRYAGGSFNGIGWIMSGAANVGQVFVVHWTIDSATRDTRIYVNGVRVWTGSTLIPAAPTSARAADLLTVGRYQYATALSNPSLGLISVCGSETTVMTPDQIALDASIILGTPGSLTFPTIPGESARYAASDLVSSPAAWHDQDGDDATLARTGTPVVAVGASGMQFYGVKGLTWSDSELPGSATYHDIPNQFASVRFTTNSGTLMLGSSMDNTAAPNLGWAGLGVSVDGGAVSSLPAGGGCVSLGTPGVLKTVEVIVGPQLYVNVATNQGIWLDKLGVTANSSLSMLGKATTTRRLVTINDSIFSGFFVDVPVTHSPHMLLRAAYPGRMTGMGAGSYSLRGLSTVRFASLDALADAVVALCDGTITNEILIQIGTVDFNAGIYSAATYRPVLASFLTKLRARTTAHIWLQTIGIRTDVATNPFGDSIATWRTAQAGAVTDSGISDVTTIDGSTMYASGDLNTDHVHLTTAGAANYATALRAVLGF